MLHTNHGHIYSDFIQQITQLKNARSYMEIGVRDGTNLSKISCSSIGVDPNFTLSLNPLGQKKELYLFQETSDEFFRYRDVPSILGRPIEVSFLDGLHQFEFLLRDFMNSEKVSSPDGVIFLDDCLPVNADMTERVHNPDARQDEDTKYYWTGDVWKVVPILKKYRPDLRLTLVDTVPTGTVCVTKLDPSNNVLQDNYHKIVDEFMRIDLGEGPLKKYYQDIQIVSSNTVLNNFDYSLYVGC